MNVTQTYNSFPRQSGILIHPINLPGPESCGTLGTETLALIDWLKNAGQQVWQVLPLGPTGYGDSPYSSFSSFAGNPYLISLLRLVDDGDLEAGAGILTEPDKEKASTAKRIDYGKLYTEKMGLLRLAAKRFFAAHDSKSPRFVAFSAFCQRHASWLDDYALFMAIKTAQGGEAWQNWPQELRSHSDTQVLNALRLSDEYMATRYIQWQFETQWLEVRKYAEAQGIQILGDAPIFVASDSADVWGNQELFDLDKDGKSKAVAGVPPDYFSATGQLWGNPLYKWDVMKKRDYAWWKSRLTRVLSLVHSVRIDHFRGFAQFWRVPADAKTAIGGTWTDGPGADFFTSLQNTFGKNLPLIAEDLGLITPDVVALREKFALPGMKIFCFAPWGETEWLDNDEVARPFAEHPYLPDSWEENCLAYPGTHDNDTFMGWFDALEDGPRTHLVHWLGVDEKKSGATADFRESLLHAMLQTLLESRAGTVIFQIQDILGLDSSARVNLPGTCSENNWTWRLDALPDQSITSWLNERTTSAKRSDI
jgi:4-alpha-glucanotransferase